MREQKGIFSRKGTRMIYPYTEANAKNVGLIAMTVEEAQEEGLLSPRDESVSPEAERNNLLAEENASLRDKIKALEDAQKEARASAKPAPKKKVTAKKATAEVVTQIEKSVPVPVDEAVTMKLSDIGL